MISLILFLFAILCIVFAVICAVIAVFTWLSTAAITGLLEAIEKSLASGHVIVALLYLVPAALFAYGLAQLLKLAYSFVTTVVLRS